MPRRTVADWRGKEFISLRRRHLLHLLGGGSFVIAVIMLLVSWAILQGKADAHRAAEIATANLTRTLADNFNSTVNELDLGLLAIIDEVSRQRQAGQSDLAAVATALARQNSRHPDFLGFRIYDASGKLSLGINNVVNPNADLSEREDFKYLRETRHSDLVITPPLFGPTTQQWVIGLGRGITNPDGSFGGAVYCAIPISGLVKSYGALNLGPGGTVALYHSSLRIAARFPEAPGPRKLLGTATISDELRAIIASGRETAQYDYRSTVDGVRRTANVRRIQAQPYYILVGQADDHYLAAWRGNRRRFVMFGAIAIGLVLWGMLMLYRQLRESQRTQADTQLAASVFHNTAEAILITDANSQIISVNPAFSHITGYSAAEAIGQTPRLLKSDHHEQDFFHSMWADLLSQGIWRGKIWNRHKDGEAFLSWQTITSVRDETGRVVRYLSVFNDMTDMHRKEEHIHHQAYHDALTGLPNRLLLQDRLNHAIEIARREDSQLAVMFIDLDRFKHVNDSLGHDIGDLLLIQITHRLTACLRKSDTVARLGGDEFVVVVSDFENICEITEVAEKIIRLAGEPVMLKDHEVQVGASIGIALFPQDGEDVTVLMKDADTAMYRAKAANRNTFRFFDAAMDGAAVEQLKLEAALRHALEGGEFQLYYQPKIDLASGRLTGAEALIRWNSPDHGVVLPDVFIPLAEETGLIVGIGDWVLGEACRQMAEWRRRDHVAIKVAVNVSARQFLDQGFADKVARTLAECRLAPSLLEIELTESTVMANPERAITQLKQLHELGVAVSVDDFGTGYSSLAYLKRLPLDTIKIDRSFIDQVNLQAENAAIVRAIIGLGEALGMSTIAEGVETAEEERHLKAAGCGSAQGFKYAHPLPAEQFEAWLATYEAAREKLVFASLDGER